MAKGIMTDRTVKYETCRLKFGKEVNELNMYSRWSRSFLLVLKMMFFFFILLKCNGFDRYYKYIEYCLTEISIN